MQAGQPSLTALGAAALRAAHQVVDGASIFRDALALRILGVDAETVAQTAGELPGRRGLRLFIAARSRFAEDAWARALAGGTRQLVVLGAGLDTYAYRAPLPDGVRVFEVDHPATQAWKRERLAAAGIAAPAALTFAPVDFARETLADGLCAAGFARTQASFFTWLGVVPYLDEATVYATLAFIATLSGSEVVLDYANPPDALAAADGTAHEELAARVASVGEPFKSAFDTAALIARVRALGFSEVEDLGPRQIAARYLGAESRRETGGHILRAARP